MGNKFSRKSKVIHSGASDEEVKAFLKNVRPLDLLVFRGTDGVSRMIQRLQIRQNGNGDISHVETAITREWCTHIKKLKTKAGDPGVNDYEDTLLSWGSTMSGNMNDGAFSAETGEAHFGVQVRVLHDLVKYYLSQPGANVGVCRLLDNPTVQRPKEPLGAYNLRKQELIDHLNAAYDKFNGNAYNASPLALLGAIFPNMRGARNFSADAVAEIVRHNQWLFCSQFVAALYIEIGVINDETDGKRDGRILDPSDVVPVDFIGFETDEDGIHQSICDKPLWIKPLTVKDEDVKNVILEYAPVEEIVGFARKSKALIIVDDVASVNAADDEASANDAAASDAAASDAANVDNSIASDKDSVASDKDSVASDKDSAADDSSSDSSVAAINAADFRTMRLKLDTNVIAVALPPGTPHAEEVSTAVFTAQSSRLAQQKTMTQKSLASARKEAVVAQVMAPVADAEIDPSEASASVDTVADAIADTVASAPEIQAESSTPAAAVIDSDVPPADEKEVRRESKKAAKKAAKKAKAQQKQQLRAAKKALKEQKEMEKAAAADPGAAVGRAKKPRRLKFIGGRSLDEYDG